MTDRRSFMATSLAATLTLGPWAGGAHAQTARQTRMVIGFAPGGGTDTVGRGLAESLKALLPGGVIIDNRPGASGRLAVQAVKSAEPDGSTLLFTPDFVLTVYPHTFTRLGYDPVADLVPVALAAKSGLAFCAGPAVPASVKDARDYVAWVKANPTQNAYGSSGAGSTLHFAGEMLGHAAGVKLNHVPYKGGALSMQDVIGGQIPVSVNAVAEALPFLQAGRIRVLATFGDKRNAFMPQAPTMVELGYKDVVVEAWLAFLAPARTSADVVAKLAAAVNQVTASADVRERLAKFGMEPVTGSSAELAALIASDTRRWGPVIGAIGFKAEE